MVVASVYAACKEMDIPRRLDEISEAANSDKIFAGRCFRIISIELGLASSNIDAARYMSKVAENANVSQKAYRTALDLLDVVKKNPISGTARIEKHLQLLLYMALVWLKGKIKSVR